MEGNLTYFRRGCFAWATRRAFCRVVIGGSEAEDERELDALEAIIVSGNRVVRRQYREQFV